MSIKPESHHHTCSESNDHHCPGCCSCECCGESRKYHRHYRVDRPDFVGVPPQPPWRADDNAMDVDDDDDDDVPLANPPLRREIRARCENCGELRERYGVGYQCWNCGYVQQNRR